MTKIPKLLTNNIKILIVEDEILLAMAMKSTLNEFGYLISGIETTGKNAIEHVKTEHPNLIFMDINLKGLMTGIEAAKYIWESYKIPIIFLTSYSDIKTIQEALSCEPYAYLIKPCRDEELIVSIETTMQKHNLFFNEKSIEKNLISLENEFFFNKNKSVLYKQNLPLNLTGNEIKFLEILYQVPGEPVSFDRINDYIWENSYTDIARIRTLIHRLKNKIGINLIENIFEFGYKLKIKK